MSLREILLYPLALLYKIGTIIHRRGTSQRSFQIPVISVGGISAGGSGKTPVVRELIRLLQDDYFIILLTRGYGRSSNEEIIWKSEDRLPDAEIIGDEPALLGTSLSNGMIGVGKNRSQILEGIVKNIRDLTNAIAILDDGFQHYRIARDVDIVLFDDYSASQRCLLPAGYLRERHTALNRADLILVQSSHGESIAKESIQGKGQVSYVEFIPSTLCQWKFGTALQDGIDRKGLLVTGIARPERVVTSLEKYPINVVKHLKYRDHHRYSTTDLDTILKEMARHSADIIVTTEKDAVKLGSFAQLEEYLYVLPLNARFKDQDDLLQSIRERVNRKLS